MKSAIHRYIKGLSFFWLRMIGFVLSHFLRIFFCRISGLTSGRRSWIYSGAEILSPKNMSIGNDVVIGHGAILDGRNAIKIADNVSISTGVWIWTMQHDHQSETFEATGGEVKVEQDAWLSARTTVLPGVTIGAGSVVAAGAVVTKSLPARGVYAGIPAKRIADRNIRIRYKLGDARPTPFV